MRLPSEQDCAGCASATGLTHAEQMQRQEMLAGAVSATKLAHARQMHRQGMLAGAESAILVGPATACLSNTHCPCQPLYTQQLQPVHPLICTTGLAHAEQMHRQDMSAGSAGTCLGITHCPCQPLHTQQLQPGDTLVRTSMLRLETTAGQQQQKQHICLSTPRLFRQPHEVFARPAIQIQTECVFNTSYIHPSKKVFLPRVRYVNPAWFPVSNHVSAVSLSTESLHQQQQQSYTCSSTSTTVSSRSPLPD